MKNRNDFKMGHGATDKLFIIPQIPEDHQFLEAVDRKTMKDIATKYNFFIDYVWNANTIACGVVESIISNLAYELKKKPSVGVGLDFEGLFTVQVSIKKNIKAEKEGNINIFFNPGNLVTDLIENGPEALETVDRKSPEEFFKTGDPVTDKMYENIEYHSMYKLMMEHGLAFTDETPKFLVFGVAYEFIKNIYIELLYRLQNMQPEDGGSEDERLVSVNFNDNIEFHGILKDGCVTLTMRPGMNAKLLIKCDELTENTMGDDDE